jgi:D-3-phosphoglycerate dehydrogenase
MRIAVLDDYGDAFRQMPDFPRLAGHDVAVYRDSVKGDALVARLQDADVVVLTQQRSVLTRAMIEKLSNLRLIAQTGSHREHIDIPACTAQGIAVAAGGGGMAYSTAELTWGLIFAAVRHIPFEVTNFRAGSWQSTIGSELHGKTIGVYGLGRIGSTVARVANAFGLNVTCWGRENTIKQAREAGYEIPASRQAFFAGADILSLHVHYVEETRGIVKAADLACMKPSSLFVNTSRAGLIEDGALVAALRQGRPGFAAVDVYEDEPVVGAAHPLLALPNVLCTPHLGYAVREKYMEFYRVAVDSIVAFAAGKPVNVINPDALAGNR